MTEERISFASQSGLISGAALSLVDLKKLQNTAGDDDDSSKARAVRLANQGHCLLTVFMRLRPASGGRTPGPSTSFPQGFDSWLKIRSTFNANTTCGLQWLQPSAGCSA